MNRARLAQALNTIAMGFAEAAEALNESPAPEAPPPPPPTEAAYTEGSLSQCPRHHKAYRDGKVTKPNPSGKFCATKADDAWSYNGWCSINPTNAAEYLRQVAV